ncbi:MAG TPA: hypothetical protein VLX92_08185 [Kofleriaceae bacterium]|nr:hypothetical protein [Kofleriaceae bacterium]
MTRARLSASLGIAVVVAALAGVVWLGVAIAGEVARGGPPDAAHPVTLAANAGKHIRIDGPHGPIHVWIPPSYHADTGATIIYLHGYYDDADSAWTGHHLPEQFAMSALDAMFIVPEAPSGSRPPVNYPSLSELLQIVEDKTGVQRGMAFTAVVGHSGAFRTIDAWLDEPLIDELVMIDSMYANEEQIEAWYRASPRHRLVTVGEDTLQWNEQFLHDIPDTLVLDRVPPSYDTFPPEAKLARAVYIRAQYMHMPLVTDGIVLPAVLRLLPVELLADEPWKQPMGGLPPMPDAAIDAPGEDGGARAIDTPGN